MRSELRRLRGRGRHAWAVAMALLLAATAAHALDPRVAVSQYERRGWGVDEGLPNSTVTGIAQTPDGYIWVSTFEGLARFDGVRFSTCTDEPVLNAWLFSLLVDRRGTLWVGTSGKGLIANRNGVFKVEERVRALGVEDVFALALGSDESLWMGTNIGVVRRFPSGELQSWSEKDGLPAPQVRALMFARNGDLWIGTEQGVARLSGGKITHAGTAAALPSRPVRAMHEDSAGRIWVGTTEGLFCLQNGRRIRVPAVSDIETSHVASILEDEHHTLWFGSSAGLKRVAADGTTTPLVDRGLQGVFVVSLFADRERNLWLGSFSGGLDRLRDTPFRPYGSSQGLGSDTVFAVTQDRSGAMWFGTNNGAGRLRNGHVDWFTRAQGLPNDSVITVTPSRLGGVWLGMYGGGVCHVDGAVAPQCFGYAEGLSHGVVLNVLEDPDGDLWIATLGGGLNRLHHGKITAYGVQQGLPSTRITALALARDGGIWAGMISGGVVHFQDGRVVSTVPLLDGHTDVRAIIEEPDGTLWIGLDGEGTIAFVKQGRVTLCRLKAFLPVTSINNLLDDGAGSLWIITTRCIARVGKRELLDYAAGKVSSIQPVIFGRMQGVTSARFPTGQPSAWRASDGSLWFNGTRGATRLDRDALARQAVFVPGAVIESATADGLLLSGNEPVVTDREARLTFRYTALAFAVPDELTFRYKLDGYDRQWVDAGSSRSAVYTNLPPRRYTFRVMAVNRGRPWSEAGTAAFRFERLPVFTETNTFYAACALLLLAAGGAVVRMRVHNLKKRERRLTERVAEQTAALLHANTQLTTAKEAAETTAG
ncbi:MAG: two-component regulator propeller domain-containing protein, partial [Thermoanaerobaculia bacterium]